MWRFPPAIFKIYVVLLTSCVLIMGGCGQDLSDESKAVLMDIPLIGMNDGLGNLPAEGKVVLAESPVIGMNEGFGDSPPPSSGTVYSLPTTDQNVLRPVSFYPTILKEIEGANPGSGINLIEPPQVNSFGDARLTYTIDVPPGRQGLHPQVQITYDSGRGNGWLGMGWDLPVSVIAIDARWGVPRYDAAKETETYLLDDEQLTPVAHRETLQNRTTDKIFHTRVEGQFKKIIRHGDSPSNYWWEVIDKKGTRYCYGGGPDTGPTPDSTLSDMVSGKVSRWCLREVRDPLGNTIRYRYTRATDPGLGGGVVPGSQVYLSEILYTGFEENPGPYSVHFVRDRDLPDNSTRRRADVIIDARSGFKAVTADLLKRIEVRRNGHMIRHYDLEYQEGAFKKTLLKSIAQHGKNGELFNKHEFEYFDEARDASQAYVGFAPPEMWNTQYDDVGEALPDHGEASAIGGYVTTGGGGHLYLGFNPWEPTKQSSGGFKVGYNRNTARGRLTFIDLDGDSLPDKVFEDGGTVYFRRNLYGPGGSTTFGPKVVIPTLSGLFEETSDIVTYGPEVYPPLSSVVQDFTHTFVSRNVYFADVNGDGAPDLVRNGEVWFNHLDDQMIPTFTLNSQDTPVPIDAGAVDPNGLIDNFSQFYEERIDRFPLIDSVRRWVAPFSGQIRIVGAAQLIEDSGTGRQSYATADGVRIAIQYNATELWSTRIEADDYAPHNPVGVEAITVAHGDRIYFRVQSVFDGAYDQVAWNPRIDYLGVPTDAQDANLLNPYRYSSAEDYVLAGRGGKVQMPFNGTVRLSGGLVKQGVTTDDIRMVVIKNGQTIITRDMAWNQTGTISLQDNLTVSKNDILEFNVRIDSPIDVTQITWSPKIVYTQADCTGSAVDPAGNYHIQIDPPYDVDLYPMDDLTSAQEAWTAPDNGTIEVWPQLLHLPLPGQPSLNSELVLTVKRPGELVHKRVIRIANDHLPSAADLRFSLTVTEGDRLFFDFSTRHGPGVDDPPLSERLIGKEVYVRYQNPTIPRPPILVPSAFHSAMPPDVFPEPYRNWSVIAYQGNRDRANQPIDETALVLPTSPESYTLDTARFYFLIPAPPVDRWRSPDESCWVSAGVMSSSRLGLDYVDVPRPENYAGARAVSPLSSTIEGAISASFVVLSGSITEFSNSECELDYLDMNGDGFPDVVGKNRIQYTTLTGGLEPVNRVVEGLDSVRKSGNTARNFGLGLGIGGNPASNKPGARGDITPSRRDASAKNNKKGGTGSKAGGKAGKGGGAKQGDAGKQGSEMPELGFGGQVGDGTSEVEKDLVDVNGDGLPDRVSNDNGTLQVALNLGYSFGPSEPWAVNSIDKSESSRVAVDAELGYNDKIYGFGGGVSFTWEDSKTKATLLDFNGDGLMDYITPGINGFQIAFNTGAGFAAPVFWSGGCNSDVAVNSNADFQPGLYFTVGVGPLCLAGCYIIINPGGNGEWAMSRPETAMIDVNGDGYVDHVTSTRDDNLTVALNRIGRTNLLKKVIRPLGGTLTFGYERGGNTLDDSDSRWYLNRVEVFDGHLGDGADTRVTAYRFEDPVFDSNEREFYGCRTVIEEHRSPGDALYRTTTRTYANDNFYTKGLLVKTLIADGAGHPFIEEVNTYVLYDVDTALPLTELHKTTATVFPQRIRRETSFYEGQSAAKKITYVTYRYDAYGNVVEMFDAGDVGPKDDLRISTDYADDTAHHIVGTPRRIVCSSNGLTWRREEAEVAPGTGIINQICRYLADGQAATTDITYYPNGMVKRIIGPENLHGQQYTVSLEYDDEIGTHVTVITDSFGYRSTATYNLDYGRQDEIRDINGQRIGYDYDPFGRLQSINGPYQTGGLTPTIRFEYHHESVPAWARTQRINTPGGTGNTRDEILFIDGLKRIIQRKIDAAVASSGEGAPQDMMIVSGAVTFDFLGRITKRYYPTTEPLGTGGVFNASLDNVTPAQTAYDVLDRVVQKTFPSGAVNTWEHGFGVDRDGLIRFHTLFTDANGVPKRIHRNVRGLVTSLCEAAQSEAIWTSYAYDPLDRLVRIENHRHQATCIGYDLLGRRTSIDNGDTGLTQFTYDRAGNLIAKMTDGLRLQGRGIRYDYDFNRITCINYPEFPDHDIRYTYGYPTASENRAGRIGQITDQSGTEQRFYGKLGEIVKENKTIASDTQGTSPNSPERYITEYVYDTWNRLARLVYPDGEEVAYRYDRGGLVAGAHGIKKGVRTPYIEQLEYDKFQQRALLVAGNGVLTRYLYDPATGRLFNLRAGARTGSLFMNLCFDYDNVGNVLEISNDVAIPSSKTYGGPTSHNFTYDDLYRLVKADGLFTYDPNKRDRYHLELTYDTIHNLTEKVQDHELVQPSGKETLQHKTSYQWSYEFSGLHPHAATHIGDKTFTYDANGNQVGWTNDQNGTRRTFVWDEENRVRSITDNGHVETYRYDHVGRRVIKKGPQGETAYVNPYFTIRNRSIANKHVYADGLRVATKLVPNYNSQAPRGQAKPEENFLYVYHADLRGNSLYVSDANGELYQHLQCFPFGEAWIEEQSNIQRTPYRFTANELDEETGLYCMNGHQYYDPRTCMWQNPVGLLCGDLDSRPGDVYDSRNLNPYAFSGHNSMSGAPHGQAFFQTVTVDAQRRDEHLGFPMEPCSVP